MEKHPHSKRFAVKSAKLDQVATTTNYCSTQYRNTKCLLVSPYAFLPVPIHVFTGYVLHVYSHKNNHKMSYWDLSAGCHGFLALIIYFTVFCIIRTKLLIDMSVPCCWRKQSLTNYTSPNTITLTTLRSV